MTQIRTRLGRFLAASAGAFVAASLLAIGAPAGATVRGAAAIPRPPKDPAVAKLVPAATAKSGVVTYAMDATYPPDEFVAANGKTIVGMDADLAVALSAVMGVKAKLENITFDTIITGLQAGKFDVGNSSFTITSARAKVVNFVSYFQAGEGYYTKASSTLKLNGLASLCGKTVSVESGTTEQTDAQAQNTACKKAKKAGVTVLGYNDQNQANLAVSSGRAQLGFSDSQVAAYIVKQSGGQFKLNGSAFKVAPYGLAFAKSTTLDKAVLAAMKVLMKDGIYAKILAKWGTQTGSITNPRIVS